MTWPRRGEVWAYLPGVRGREKPSSIGANHILVMSNNAINAGPISLVMGIPVVTGHSAEYPTIVDIGVVGQGEAQVLAYKMRPIPKLWLVMREAVVDPVLVERVRDAVMECTSGGYYGTDSGEDAVLSPGEDA